MSNSFTFAIFSSVFLAKDGPEQRKDRDFLASSWHLEKNNLGLIILYAVINSISFPNLH